MTAPKPLHFRILVGVDEGDLSAPAVERGLDLALHHGDDSAPLVSKLRLIHSVRVPAPMWPGLSKDELAAIHSKTIERARKALTDDLEPVFTKAGLSRATIDELLEVLPGRPVGTLLHYADKVRSNLLLLGPHKERRFFDFGSTARGVLSRIQLPVWNQVEAPQAIRSILCPVDFSDCSERALDYALSLGRVFDAEVRLLHCMAPPAFAGATAPEEPVFPTYVIEHERKHATERLAQLADEHKNDGRIQTTFVEGEVADAVLEHAEKADLVCMGKHGHGPVSRRLLGNVAYKVLRRSQTPVLVLPEARRSWFEDGHLEAVPAAMF